MQTVQLSHGFTEQVMERVKIILKYYRERTEHFFLRHKKEKQTRSAVCDETFVLPYEYAVLHGLFSGANKNGSLLSAIKKWSCKRMAKSLHYPLRREEKMWMRELIEDVFDASYKIGAEFRGTELDSFPREQGIELILSITKEFSLNFRNPEEIARDVWMQYSHRRTPHFAA